MQICLSNDRHVWEHHCKHICLQGGGVGVDIVVYKEVKKSINEIVRNCVYAIVDTFVYEEIDKAVYNVVGNAVYENVNKLARRQRAYKIVHRFVYD